MDYSRPELADRLAADYVTGTLRGPARRRLEALLPAHPALRAAERAWRDRLMPLADAVGPVQPSAAVWARIEARIHGAAAASAASTAWRRRLAFWRGFSGLATAAALGLAVLVTTPGPTQPPVIVVLSAAAPPAGSAAGAFIPASFVASISADGRTVVTKPLNTLSLQPGRAFELWALPASGSPRSLGVIAADKATVMQRDTVPAGTAALAVTLEPAGGSPTGAPTGPVLFAGKLAL